MSLSRISLVAVVLFLLTCLLCASVNLLLLVSPVLTVLLLLFGTLGIVLATDILQAAIFDYPHR